MRVLICGDRHWDNYHAIARRMDELPRDAIIIEGEAAGADQQAARVARDMNAAGLAKFTIEPYPAQWRSFGRAAGPIRNQKMLDSGVDLVLAFHANIAQSKGTADMVRRATRAGVPVEVIIM